MGVNGIQRKAVGAETVLRDRDEDADIYKSPSQKTGQKWSVSGAVKYSYDPSV